MPPEGQSLPATRSGRECVTILSLTCLAVAMAMSSWFSAAAVASELRELWALSGPQASALTGAVQVGFVLGALGSSALNLPDLLRPARLMTICAALAAAANLALLLAPSLPLALVSRLLTGAMLAGVYPPALKLVAGWFVQARGLALGAVIAALTLGSALPHLMRALTDQIAWREVILLSSMLTFGGAIVFGLFIREGPHAAPPAPFDPRQLGAIFRDRRLMLVNIGYFGHMWELYAMWALFGFFASRALPQMGLSAQELPAFVTFVVIASGVIGALAGGILADRMGRAPTTIIMLAISGSCSVGIGFVFDGPFWLFVTLACLWGGSVIGDSAQFSALATEIGSKRYIGTALTLQLGIGFAITGLSIQCTSLFASWVGWQWAFLILAPGPMIGIAAMRRLQGEMAKPAAFD